MGVHFRNADVVFKSVSPPFVVKNNSVPVPVVSGWSWNVLGVTETKIKVSSTPSKVL